MVECFPNILSIDRIKRSFEIDKVDVQRKIVLNAVMNYRTERINLIDARSVLPEPTLIFPE